MKLGDLAWNGTKVKANASKRGAMSYEDVQRRTDELAAEVARWLAEAEATDTEDVIRYGKGKRGVELP